MTVDAQPHQSPARLAFIKFVVRDLDRMEKFYCSVLGLTCARVVESDVMIEKILRGADDGLSLVLYFYKDQREITVGNGHGPLGCYVTDVDAAIEKAIKEGATLYRSPFDVGGLRVGFVRDPDGRQIEFISDPGRPA